MDLRKYTNDNAATVRQAEALDNVLHWIWNWRLQLQRLVSTTNAQGQGADDIEKRRSFSNASYDEHALVIVGGNMVKAINKARELFSAIRLAEDKSEGLRLLRNLYEHWDEHRQAFQNPAIPKKRSAKEFAARFPEGRPRSITYDHSDWLLAGVLGLNVITAEVAKIETEALELERRLLKH